MPLKLVTPPTVEPITLAEAKMHLRVEHDAEDALIESLITAAREQAEHTIGRPIPLQTWELALDAFPSGAIYLEKPNVRTVVSVGYIDDEGEQQSVEPENYSLDNEDSASNWLHPAVDVSWPATKDTANAVRVRFTAGYEVVPASIKAWIKLTVAHYYANREAVAQNNLAELPGIARLLDAERIFGL